MSGSEGSLVSSNALGGSIYAFDGVEIGAMLLKPELEIVEDFNVLETYGARLAFDHVRMKGSQD